MTGFGKESRGQILYHIASIAIETLGSQVVKGSSVYALAEDFRVLKLEVMAVHYGQTQPHLDDTSLVFGLADGDLADSEIEECIEALAFDSNQVPEIEYTHRTVFPLGMITYQGPATSTPTYTGYLNGGMPVAWKQRWTFKNPEGWKFWVYNLGPGSFTTGSVLYFMAKIYGVWVS